MKTLKKIGKWLLIILVVLNLAIVLSGRLYLYKLINHTLLKGRMGPAINESQIFANREVKAGKYQPWTIGKDYNKAQIPDKYRKEMDRLKTIAFLVIKDDSIRYEEYWDGYGVDSHTNSFSMAKSILGVLCGVAIKDGKIGSIDDPITRYLKDFKGDPENKITIRHLLTMSSGINFEENYLNPLAYPAEAYYGKDLKELTYKTKYVSTDKPGQIFKYLSGDSQLLAFVIEAATGMHVADYASEKLWKKIGAKNDAWWNLDHEGGNEKAFCCFNSNAQDFARFGKLLLNYGRWNDEQIIDSSFIASMTCASKLKEESGATCERYGYQWWIIPDFKGHRIVYMRGILGQYVLIVPDMKMIVVRLGHKRDKPGENDLYPPDVNNYLGAAIEMYSK